MKKIENDFDTKLSARTVARYRADLGWVFEHTRYCQFIREKNRLLRVKWCEDKVERNESFNNYVFSDECTVMLERAKVKRYRRYYDRVECLHARVKHPIKVHVWAAISPRGASKICIFDGKTRLNSQNYCRILERFYLPFAGQAYGNECILVQDNAPQHTSRETSMFLENHDIKTTDWPPESPDINCIELVWSQLKDFLRKYVKPTTKDQLTDGIKLFWSTKMTPEQCKKYVTHTRKWIHKVLECNGGPTGK